MTLVLCDTFRYIIYDTRKDSNNQSKDRQLSQILLMCTLEKQKLTSTIHVVPSYRVHFHEG